MGLGSKPSASGLKSHIAVSVGGVVSLLWFVSLITSIGLIYSFAQYNLQQQGEKVRQLIFAEVAAQADSDVNSWRQWATRATAAFDTSSISLSDGNVQQVISVVSNDSVPTWRRLVNPFFEYQHKVTLQSGALITVVLIASDSVNLVAAMLWFWGVIALIALVLVRWVSMRWYRDIAEPLALLQQQTEALQQTSFELVSETSQVRELQRLLGSHNVMAKTMQAKFADLQHQLEIMRTQLYRDEVTQLGNRRLFNVHLNAALQEKQLRFGGLVVTRIQNFERVRSYEGFATAKSVLVAVIEAMKTKISTSEHEVRLYRLNEYEIAAMVLDLTPALFAQSVRAIHAELDIKFAGHKTMRDIYVGAMMFRNGQKMGEVLARLDESLSLALHDKSRCHMFDSVDGQKWENKLLQDRESLLNTINSMTVHFVQHPIVKSGHDEVTGYELLIRAHHKEVALSPALLCSQAVRFGLASALDKIVISRLVELFLSDMLPGRVHINVIPQSFLNSNFVDWLQRLVMQHPAFFALVCWELDEFALTQEKHTHVLLNTIKKLGGQIVLDNFGNSTNALQNLKAWPIDMIKLDGSFIRDAFIQGDGEQYLASLIELAHSLSISVICSQIENDEEQHRAVSLGFDQLQGYFIRGVEELADTKGAWH